MSQPAHAALPGVPDCSPHAPAPQMPGTGYTSMIVKAPDPLPPERDAFPPGQPPRIFEQYGLAGFEVVTYDQGCATGFEDFMQNIATLGTNVEMVPVLGSTAALSGFSTVAYTPASWTPALDGPVGEVIGALREALYTPLAPILAMGLMLFIAFWAWQIQLSKAASLLGLALLVAFGVAVVSNFPTETAQTADSFIEGTVGGVANEVGGTADTPPDVAISSAAVNTVLWPRFKAFYFGSTDSPTAEKYAPDLFRGLALTWREKAAYDADPDGAGKRIVDEHKRLFEQTASAIKAEDPLAYGYLTGDHPVDRLGEGLIAILVAIVVYWFWFWSNLLIVASYLIVRIALIVAIPMLLAALWPPTQRLARVPIDLTVAALVNAAIFAVASLAYFYVVQAAQASPYLADWVALLVIGLFGFFLWKALSPFRRLTRMVGGSYSPTRQVSKGWADTRAHAGQFGQAALSDGAAAAASPYALAGTVAARRFAKRNTVGDEPLPQTPDTNAPAQTPDTTPPRRPRHPEARPAPWRPELDPAPVTVPAGQTAGARRAPQYTDRDGQQVWLIYDPRADRVDTERPARRREQVPT